MQRIILKDKNIAVDFPDSMSQDQIRQAIQKKFYPQPKLTVGKELKAVAESAWGNILGAAEDFNQAIGLGLIDKNLTSREPSEKYINKSKQTTKNSPTLTAVNSFLGQVAGLAPSVAGAGSIGGLAKAATFGKYAPEVAGRAASIFSKIPNWVIGGGIEGASMGYQNKKGSVGQKLVAGAKQGAENAAFNELYSGVGKSLGANFIKNVPAMAGIGAGTAVYNAAKQGRKPTSQELENQIGTGAAYGVLFSVVPTLFQMTGNKKLGELDKKITKSAKAGDIEGLLKHIDEFQKDPNVPDEIKQPVAESLKGAVTSEEINKAIDNYYSNEKNANALREETAKQISILNSLDKNNKTVEPVDFNKAIENATKQAPQRIVPENFHSLNGDEQKRILAFLDSSPADIKKKGYDEIYGSLKAEEPAPVSTPTEQTKPQVEAKPAKQIVPSDLSKYTPKQIQQIKDFAVRYDKKKGGNIATDQFNKAIEMHNLPQDKQDIANMKQGDKNVVKNLQAQDEYTKNIEKSRRGISTMQKNTNRMAKNAGKQMQKIPETPVEANIKPVVNEQANKGINTLKGKETTLKTNAKQELTQKPQHNIQPVAKTKEIRVYTKDNSPRPWREVYDKSDALTKSEILERVADKSKNNKELDEILNKAKGLPNESRVAWAVAHNNFVSKKTFDKAISNSALRAETSDENLRSAKEERYKKGFKTNEPVKETPKAGKPKEQTAKTIDSTKVMTEKDYLNSKGAVFNKGTEPALYHNIQEGRAKQQMIKKVADENRANIQKREELRKEYKRKVESGEIRPPNKTERLISTANGNPDNEATRAARRLLRKQGIDWKANNGKQDYMFGGIPIKPEQLKAGIEKSKAALKEITEPLQDLFVPESKISVDEKTGKKIENAKEIDALLADNIAKENRLKTVLNTKWKPIRDYFAAMPVDKHLQFIDLIQRGKLSRDDLLNLSDGDKDTATFLYELAPIMRKQLDGSYEEEVKRGIHVGYLENYFPNIWDNIKKAKTFFKQYAQQMGVDKFAKQRFWKLMKDGIEVGKLKPKFTNPVDIMLTRIFDATRATMRQDFFDKLEAEGFAKKYTKKSIIGDGVLVDAPNGKRYIVVPDAAPLLNNAIFAKGLWGRKDIVGKGFKGFMYLKNVIVPIKLTVSAFHPFHILGIHSSAQDATIMYNMLHKNIKAGTAFKELLKVNTVAGATDYKYGIDIVNAWDKQDKDLKPYQQEAVRYIQEGGGTAKMPEFWRTKATEAFSKAVKEGKYPGATAKIVPALIEKMSSPIFEKWIPALKVASYLKETALLLKEHPELVDKDVERKMALRKIWKSVDNRYGEMFYKTLFWHPLIKDITMGNSLSMGWSLGYFREFGGAVLDAKDMAKAIMDKTAAKMKGNPTDIQIKNYITKRMIFVADYTIRSMITGGLITYAMTGKMPTQLLDYFFPKTGDGDTRFNTPWYTREPFSLWNHWEKQGYLKGTARFFTNKANPVISPIINAVRNKDYFGYEVRDPNSPYVKQLEDTLGYLVTREFFPISVTSYMRAKQKMSPTKAAISSFMGHTLAPKYVEQSKIQTDIFSTFQRRFSGGAKTLHDKEKHQALAKIRELHLQGKDKEANKQLGIALKKGYITRRGISRFVKNSDLPSDIRAFRALPDEDQRGLINKMSLSDVEKYVWYVHKSTRNMLPKTKAVLEFIKRWKAGKERQPIYKRQKIVRGR